MIDMEKLSSALNSTNSVDDCRGFSALGLASPLGASGVYNVNILCHVQSMNVILGIYIKALIVNDHGGLHGLAPSTC